MTFTSLRPTAWILSCLFLLGVTLFSGCSQAEQFRHRRDLDRIAEHLRKNSPGPDKDNFQDRLQSMQENIWPTPEQARAVLLSSLGVALPNEFWHAERCDRAKLRAVLARLEANDGADLRTVEGCLQIFNLMLEVTPTAREYGPFTYIIHGQSVGTFPKPGDPMDKRPSPAKPTGAGP